MTKADLVQSVADRCNCTKKEAEIMVNTFLDSIVEAVKTGEGVELRGFGSFRIRKRPAREGRNPRTGAQIKVAAKHVPYFKVGKELKARLNS